MRPAKIRAASLAVLVALVTACSTGGGKDPSATTTRQVVPRLVTTSDGVSVVPVTGSTTVVHDPDVVRLGNTFHLFSTGTWIDHRTSTDLVHWRKLPSVFDGPPKWLAADLDYEPSNLWAPDLSWWGNTWHLYYAASQWAPDKLPTRNSVIIHATSPTLDPSAPDYGWADHGVVVRSQGAFAVDISEGWNAIDPNVVLDGNQPWLAWGSGYGGLFIQELRADGTLDTTTKPVNIARRDENPAHVIEAPKIVRRGKWWYLFASYDLCCYGAKSNYNVRVGRSRALTGPYRDASGRLLTEGGGTKILSAHEGVGGTGHQSVLEVDGRWWIFYHWYDPAHDGRATLGISPLDFDNRGWPSVRGWSPAIATKGTASGFP